MGTTQYETGSSKTPKAEAPAGKGGAKRGGGTRGQLRAAGRRNTKRGRLSPPRVGALLATVR